MNARFVEMEEYHCPNCNSKLLYDVADDEYYCPKCSTSFWGKDIQNLKDAEMIEDDIQTYKHSIIYK